jgi:hypothetical protein
MGSVHYLKSEGNQSSRRRDVADTIVEFEVAFSKCDKNVPSDLHRFCSASEILMSSRADRLRSGHARASQRITSAG